MMMLVHFFVLYLVCGNVENAKILGVFPAPSKSHYILGKVLFEELAKRGHEVTVISPYEEDNPYYKGIKLDYTRTMTDEEKNMNFFTRTMSNPVLSMLFLNYAGGRILDFALSQPEIQNMLNSDEKFDAVIMDQFVTDGFAYFAQFFNATNILLSTTASNPRANFLVGNPASPSYVSELFMGFSGRMNFFERVQNTLFYIFGYLNRIFYVFPQQNRILRNKLKQTTPPLYDYLYNVSLVLLNGHESYSDPTPNVPVMKNIGGFHVKKSGKLPENLQKFMDDATDGVVYFSMGSNLKSKQLPDGVRNAILNVFSKLKTKILWKWEDDVLPGKPDNVLLQKWFPQQEILAHPNLKLFITHGGLLSSIEAIYHGVPLLAIPVYGDQRCNAFSAKTKGYAIDIPFFEFDEEKFENAVTALLNNPKYKQNAVLRSKIFHDRPIDPLDEAIYWIEYVIRHKGAEHLRVATLSLSWYQYLLLDVAAFLLSVFIFCIYIFRILFKRIFKKSVVKIKTN